MCRREARGKARRGRDARLAIDAVKSIAKGRHATTMATFHVPGLPRALSKVQAPPTCSAVGCGGSEV